MTLTYFQNGIREGDVVHFVDVRYQRAHLRIPCPLGADREHDGLADIPQAYHAVWNAQVTVRENRPQLGSFQDSLKGGLGRVGRVGLRRYVDARKMGFLGTANDLEHRSSI